MLFCSGLGHGTPWGRLGSYKCTCVSIMGTEYLWPLARVTAVAIATVPAVAAFMNLRRSTSASSCASLGSNPVCDHIISFQIGAKSQTGQSAAQQLSTNDRAV